MGICEVLIPLTTSPSSEVQGNSAAALGNLSSKDGRSATDDYSAFNDVWEKPDGGLHKYLYRFLTSPDATFQHIAVWTIVQLLESGGRSASHLGIAYSNYDGRGQIHNSPATSATPTSSSRTSAISPPPALQQQPHLSSARPIPAIRSPSRIKRRKARARARSSFLRAGYWTSRKAMLTLCRRCNSAPWRRMAA